MRDRKAEKRAWYQANRERLIKEARERRANRTEEEIEADKAKKQDHYLRNAETVKERIREKTRERWLAHDARGERNQKRAEAYHANPERAREQAKLWRQSNNPIAFKLRLKKYAISVEEFAHMLNTQDLKCAACLEILDLNSSRTHIDHCHTSGKVRGILCANCNSALGHARDSVARLQGLIKYLEQHR